MSCGQILSGAHQLPIMILMNYSGNCKNILSACIYRHKATKSALNDFNIQNSKSILNNQNQFKSQCREERNLNERNIFAWKITTNHKFFTKICVLFHLSIYCYCRESIQWNTNIYQSRKLIEYNLILRSTLYLIKNLVDR